jgi:hypothetical protein
MMFIDFETKSACDLKKHGVYNYCQDRSTEVLCMSYAFDDDVVQTWTPDQPFPERVRNFKGQIRAHNSVDCPVVQIGQFCTTCTGLIKVSVLSECPLGHGQVDRNLGQDIGWKKLKDMKDYFG